MADLEVASGGAVLHRRRHWLLTAYLALTLLLNLLIALVYVLGSQRIMHSNPGIPPWGIPALIALSVVNIICTVALFNWWKWGFWGLAANSFVIFGLNLAIGQSVGGAIVGFLGPALMFSVLNVGSTDKAWPQLR
jgi:hypothetical protein